MKCTDRKIVKVSGGARRCIVSVLGMILMISSMTGCGNTVYEIPYEADSQISSYNVIFREKPGVADSFASDLCVVTEDVTDDEAVDMSKAGAAILADVNNNEVLYAKNVHSRLYPASLTKIMTALVALKYGSTDQVLTATSAVNITESGAQLCGLKAGDTMTLNQALHILLIYSANDVAMLIADNIGGSVDAFVQLMNDEAKALGATNTNFANPHGLTDENHYTTVYDLYLIFNEAIRYDFIQEIIHMTEYQTTFYDKNGAEKKLSIKSTNRFFRGDFTAPDQVTVIGGKTGTTNAAGHCLMLLSRDVTAAPYISIILRSESSDVLYSEMIDLLDEIHK